MGFIRSRVMRFQPSARAALWGLVLVCGLIPVIELFSGPTGDLDRAIPLLFLVPVLLASTLGGRAAGIVVGIAATLAWDWFFVPPYQRLTVASPSYLAGVVVFMGVAVLTGQLATLVRGAERKATQRARTAEALYGLSLGLIARFDVMTTLPPLAQGIQEVFDLEACAVLLPGEETILRTATAAGKLNDRFRAELSRDVSAAASWAAAHGSPTGFDAGAGKTPLSRVRFMPLRVGAHANGVLELVQRLGSTLDSDQEQLLSTLANGVALALEHDRLAVEEQQTLIATESDRLKSVLLSSVSHDLRTPLAGIKASVSSLLQRDIQWTDTDRDGFLEDIDAEVDRLTRLVSNLLDLSRIEAGALRPEREWEDVGELIRRVVHRMEPGMRGHSITLDFPADLPAAEVDAVQIEQVLANLLDNAVKYAPPETEVYVEASVVHAPDGLRIGVTDAGKPIPPDQRSKIFDKFYRMKDTSRSTKGTGMGLAIVKGLIEAHGGSVSVEGSDAGNTFVLWLPLGDHHPTVPPVDSSQLSSRPS